MQPLATAGRNQVTIDERLERLAERHEALTQAVELMQRDWDARFQQIASALERDAEDIRGLARIAELHHERLEGGH